MRHHPVRGLALSVAAFSILSIAVVSFGVDPTTPALAAPPSYSFSTGSATNSIAVESGSTGAGGSTETADDFAPTTTVSIASATFTGLVTGSATVQSVAVEIFRTFPLDSTTPGSTNVPTRANTPSDVAFASRSSATTTLTFTTTALSAPGGFTALNTVVGAGVHAKPNQTTGGSGAQTGTEYQFTVTFTPRVVLPADHYFFVPVVAVTGGSFLWLSSAHPILGGTAFSPDLQSAVRTSSITPDWLRVGTDVVGGAAQFNQAFTLAGQTCVSMDLTPAILTTATIGVPFTQQLDGTASTAPYAFSTASTLPGGVTLTAAGLLSGTPIAAGSFPLTVTVRDAAGCTSTVSRTLTVNPTSDYVPLVPVRLLDTRPEGQVGYTGGRPAAGQTVQLDVTRTGTSNVPDDALAVALNVTGTNASVAGFVTVWPCGETQPTASNLNLRPGVISPNLVISKIGTGGKVCMFTQSGADLIADLNGYVPAGSRYVPLVPERLLDTRPPAQLGYTGSKPAAGATVVIQVTGAGASKIPANATAAVLNVTGVDANAAGFATVWPCGAPRPTTSNLNLVAGGTSPNLIISKIGDGGRVCVFVQSSMDLAADVSGFVPAGSSYRPVVPERLLDTRDALEPAAGSTTELVIVGAGVTQVPAGTNAVVLNVTGIDAVADGFVTVWPCGTTRPTASNLNLVSGGISPNLVIAKLGTGGKVCIYIQAAAQLVVDVNGSWP